MPIVEVEGQEIEFPDSMSRDEIKSVLQKKFSAPQTKQQGTAGGAGRAFAYGFSGGQIPFGNVITSGIGAGIAKVASPFTGDERTFGQLYDQAQMDTKATQEANPNATLAGNIAGIVSTLPAAFSKPVQGAGIIATPAKGLQKLGNFTGKMVSATPFKGSGMLAGAGNLGTRMVGGAAVSAPVGGLYAAGEADAGNRMEALGKGASTGAYLGAAFPVAGALVGGTAKGVKNLLTPYIDDAAKETGRVLNSIAQKHGIDLKVSDVAGTNRYKRMITQGEALPLSGAASKADETQMQINRAVTRTLGEEADKVTPEYLNKIRQNLGTKFEEFTKGKEFTITPDAYSKIDDIANIASRKGYGVDGDSLFKQYFEELNSLVDDRGLIKGDKLDKLRRDLSKVARIQGESDIGKVASDFEDAIVDIISDSNPSIQKSISDTKYKYKNYKVLLSPAARNQATGDISPLSLSDAVKRVYGIDSFATGRAGDLGEIARVGQALRKPTTSGTAENLLTQRGLIEHALRTPQYIANSMVQSYNRNPKNVEQLLKVIEQGGKVTNQMVAKLPKSEQKKFLSEVMQMPVAKAQAIFGEKIKPAMQKSKQFAKDYIADESGALKLLPDSQNYRIAHTAPLKSGANTLDNISDIYPDDIYNPSTAWRYYGHGGDSVNMDKKTAQIISKYKNNPEAEVTIYRAVPKGVKNINSGDWVTVNKDYAASHGKAHIYQGLSGGGKKEFDIIEKKVKAKNLSTDGNSIHEWGYND